MPKYADYIKRIEIDSLWSGKKHIIWELNRQVNILSGSNGQGKSTILNKVVKGLSAGGEFPSHMLKGVKLDVVPEDAKWIKGMMEACDGKVKGWDLVNEAIAGGGDDGQGNYALQHSTAYNPSGNPDATWPAIAPRSGRCPLCNRRGRW